MSAVATSRNTRLAVESADFELAGRIERTLASTGYLPLRSVVVKVHEGLVTLKGRVPSYYMKQMAQTAAMQHQVIEMLCNDIEVAP